MCIKFRPILSTIQLHQQLINPLLFHNIQWVANQGRFSFTEVLKRLWDIFSHSKPSCLWALSLTSVEAPIDTALKRSLPWQDPHEEWDFREGQRSLWQRTWEQVWWISTHTSCCLKKEAGEKVCRGQMSVNLISA